MLLRHGAGAALILVLLLVPSLDQPDGATAGAAGAHAPSSDFDWVISGSETFSGPKIFSANITIEQNGVLTLEGATIMIVQNAGTHWTVRVKSGGSLCMRNWSSLYVPQLEVEPGAEISLKESQLNISGMCNISGNFYIYDSEVIVTGANLFSASEPGESATLVLGGALPGIIHRSVVMVAGGDGQKGETGAGSEGGVGGNATLIVHCTGFADLNMTVRAGDGGKGGTPGNTTIDGGMGGRGGNAVIRLTGDRISNSTIAASSGNGGDGAGGFSTSGIDAGHGGKGGDGGDVDFSWTGNDLVADRANITVASGNGGEGGNGGTSRTAGKNGGNGGRGGDGGNTDASINPSGTLTMTDSIIAFQAGCGLAGGVYGRADQGGKDGSAGDGGGGGKASLTVICTDLFSASNSSMGAVAGNGGAGGIGSTGGKGGQGGGSLLNLTVRDSRTRSRASLADSTLSSCGGNGGDGGKGLSTGQSQGQPGDGGKGGGAKLFISCSDNLTVDRSHLICYEGKAGGADSPATPGNPGVGELYIYAVNVLMRNSTYSQTMGWVDNDDYWRLESTALVRTNPPLKPPHFLPVTENGVAEEYWPVTCVVMDYYGNRITDGSANVTIFRDELAVDSKRTDSVGEAEFFLLYGRYSTNSTDFGMVYQARATDDLGRFSEMQTIQLYQPVILILIDKPFPPLIMITSLDVKIWPVINASQYSHPDGRTEMFILEGTTQDHPMNPMPNISAVEVRIGDDGPWILVSFEMTAPNFYKWNYTWDIYNWSLAQLARYPLGIIPCPIYVRAFNDYLWGNHSVNLTLKLLNIPPPPPKIISITAYPVVVNGTLGRQTWNGDMATFQIPFETTIHFEAVVRVHEELKIIRFDWCFDDSSGNHVDHSSPDCSTATATYSIDQLGEYITVLLQVFDNMSATRAALYRAGVPYSEFGYDFNTFDGSGVAKLRIHIVEPPHPPEEPDNTRLIVAGALFVAIIVAVMLAFRKGRREGLAEGPGK